MFKISIIVPVFNVEDYIEIAFNSILNQTIGFNELEVIFVDDASTDNCPNIIDEYSRRYDNVVAIHLRRNSGAAGRPRNVGMEYASADYIMFLDPDDFFIETACELLYSEITNEKIDVVSGIHTLDGVDIQRSLWKNILTDPYDNDKNRTKKVKDRVKDNNFYLKLNSIDDYPSVISNFGMWTKIYDKSFLQENNIKFLDGVPAQDSVFLFEVLLNAKGIKFINKVITDHINRTDSISYEITKNRVKQRLDSYFEMFYISCMKNKLDLFTYFLLFNKLNYFINKHLLICDLSTLDIIDILEYSYPLFKLYVDYFDDVKGKHAQLFNYISNKNYENAIKLIQGENLINQNEITIYGIFDGFWHNLFNDNCISFNLDEENWINRFKIEKPNLFVFCSSKKEFGLDALSNILEFCAKNNIISIFLNCGDCEKELMDLSLKFDYIFDISNDSLEFYLEKKYNNIFKLETTLNLNVNLSLNDRIYKILENQNIFIQILRKLDYKFIPNFKQLYVCYKVSNLSDLNIIYNHFDKINYYYKHIKLIVDKYNLFLSNSILKEELCDFTKENELFVFIEDLNLIY